MKKKKNNKALVPEYWNIVLDVVVFPNPHPEENVCRILNDTSQELQVMNCNDLALDCNPALLGTHPRFESNV